MIKKVQDGVFEYTISDEDIALVNASYYPDIDISTAISFPQQERPWGQMPSSNFTDKVFLRTSDAEAIIFIDAWTEKLFLSKSECSKEKWGVIFYNIQQRITIPVFVCKC